MDSDSVCGATGCTNAIGAGEFACEACLAAWARASRSRAADERIERSGLPPKYRTLSLGQVVQRGDETERGAIERACAQEPRALAITRQNADLARALLGWSGGGFLIEGPVGAGKTTLLAARFAERLRAGDNGMFLAVPGLIRKLRGNRESAWALADQAAAAEVLLMDDLGRPDDIRHWMAEPIEHIVARRTELMLPTLISTNYSLDHMERIYRDYVMSRLRELCGANLHRLEGPDLRRP